MAVTLDSTCIKRPRKRRRLGVLEHFHTQQGEFWREDIKAFFFFPSFSSLGKGVIRAVSPHREAFGCPVSASNQLIYPGICFAGIHIIQPT